MTDKNNHNRTAATIFHNAYTAWIILAISLSITFFGWWISSDFSKQLAEDRFDAKANEIALAVKDRMDKYEQALWGGVALFNSSDSVTRNDWKNYVETLNLQNKLPGIQGLGFAIPIQPNELEDHVDEIRSDGFPDYTVRPEEQRDFYTAIIYLEPFDWRNQRAFGYDMWSNDMRREALYRAVVLQEAATTGIITLVQETEEDVQKGFLTYLPVFEKEMPLDSLNQRMEALKGWVYAAFRAGDLMEGILGSRKGINLELYDADKIETESLLYDSDSICHLSDSDFSPDFQKWMDLEIQGRQWQILIHSSDEYIGSTEKLLPWFVAIGGFLIDVLLFVVIFSIYRAERRAHQKAFQMTQELRDNTILLEKRNLELTQFAHITSHDLQEPLRSIRSFIDLLNELYADKLDEKGKQITTIIANSSDRMSNLISSLLNYSRLGTSADKEIVDCNEILSDVVKDLDAIIQESKTNIKIADLPCVYGYKAELKMLFQNLLNNAIKFRKTGVDPIIKVSVEEKNQSFIFRVEDNGIGISESYFDKIFLIFQRLHRREEYEGTGIGLAHCKKIIELHEGKIWVESTEGEGTTFFFSLKHEIPKI